MTYYMTNDDYLIHYGVKGMKWGVRRMSKQYISDYKKWRTSRKNAAQQKKDRKEAKKQRKRPISEMSDAEIQSEIARLEQEKRLKNLRNDQHSEGRKFVAKATERTMTNLAVQVGTFALGMALNYVAVKAAVSIGEHRQKSGKKPGMIIRDITDNHGIVNARKGQKDKK